MQKSEEAYFDPVTDTEGGTAYIGAQIPTKLYELIKHEAAATMVPRAQVIRWALADRYGRPPEPVEHESPKT